MNKKELRRKRTGRIARAKRRKRRKRIILIKRLSFVAALLVGLAGAGLIIYNSMPETKISKQLKEANAYIETQDYDDAIASCEEALKIDSTSVEVYRAMAGAYLTKEDHIAAEQILYQGWETTQDESLLQYYCTVILNEVVEEINNQNCSLETLDKCVSALEKVPDNEDAFQLLDACYTRLFTEEADIGRMLCNTEEGCSFNKYQDIMLKMLLIYETSPSERLKEQIIRFAVPGETEISLEVSHLQEYQELLTRIGQVGGDEQTAQLSACTAKAIEMQEFFKEAFQIFESGDFAPIKEFMNTEKYISLRDEFLNGTMEYWKGETYIPVSREKMRFTREDDGWKFAFADYEECGNASAVVNLWSAKHEDDGVQRLCISYEPVSENGEYYPHTTYEVIYLYSNVQIGRDNYVPQMNYRFETRVETQEGTVTELIGDWGGEHEWTMEF